MKILHFRLLFASILLVCFFSQLSAFGQTITADPPLPSADEAVTITFNAEGTPLEGYTGDVYTHTGLIIEGSSSWTYVIGDWGDNDTQPQLTRIGEDLYELEITPTIRGFYNADPDDIINQMAFVFRAENNSPQTQDLFVDVVQPGLAISLISPAGMQPAFELNDTVILHAAANEADSILLYVNNEFIAGTDQTELLFEWVANETGLHEVLFVAMDQENQVEEQTYFYIIGQVPQAELPQGVVNGINYIDENTVTLVLHDPPALKDFVFAIGDFNNWELSDQSLMNRTPDGTHYWLTITGLDPDTEYAFQYYIDGEMRLADPYTHKVLVPGMDEWIDDFNYPDLKPYPYEHTEGIVSIIHHNWQDYQWQTEDFTPPAVEDLVIYELLIRDFVDTDAINTVRDSLDYLQNLGVNAIELMPINEFEGNDSWGYNPAFYFATDKAYGTWNDYKAFVDECHSRGIAVIIDMVLNHSFGQSPLVQMYFDPQAGTWGQPSPENPWYNEVCPHEPWCWGYDFNHLSPYTQEFVDRVNAFWLNELRVDGFRFDFTKGFTNEQTGGSGWDYDAQRVQILKRMASELWEVNPEAYVILEHFAANEEEKELAEFGMLVWGNMNYAYNEATMGWLDNSDFSWASYQERNFQEPHLVAYMESHDEERLMFKNLQYGNSTNPAHNVKDMTVALQRNELATVFFLSIPGPKMIWQFGEIGYDYSINYCPDGTIDEACRVARKPVPEGYFDDWRRRRLYNIYSLMANLKTSYPVFATEDFTLDVDDAMKKIYLYHETTDVVILGNFDVVEGEIIPGFTQTGTWYEYFMNEQITVEDINEPITLQPGEYRLYSTVAFPDHGLPLNVTNHSSALSGKIEVYPNPSSEGFWFSLHDVKNGQLLLEVYNLQGQLVYSSRHENIPGGNTIYWDADSNNGEKITTGMYFYKITTGEKEYQGKLIFN